MSETRGAEGPPTLRDRKRERTRRAIVDAAVRLFEQRGYGKTTIADIAAAADIGTRTFFGYFSSKDEVLFPSADARVGAALRAIATRRSGDRPMDTLLRAVSDLSAAGDRVADRLGTLRLRLVQTVPAVGGRALRRQWAAQRRIAAALAAAYPDDLDGVSANAIAGAFVGAVAGALQALYEEAPDAPGDAEGLQRRLRGALDTALRADRPSGV